MDKSKVLGNYGRGLLTKDLYEDSLSVNSCPPEPSLRISKKLNVASGRAAQVLRQIKQCSVSKAATTFLENQLFIRCTVAPWYKYLIEFQPIITSRTTRFKMINHLSKHLGYSHKLYDGQFLYVTQQLSDEILNFNTTVTNTFSEVRVRFIDTINIEELPIHLVNILFRLAIDHGRQSIINIMYHNDRHVRPRVRHWNGKVVQIERKDGGLLLTIDFIQKSSVTCYEELERFYMSACNDEYQELARKELVHKLVLTKYDHRTQRIDNIDFQLTPATFTLNDDLPMTLVDYFSNKFDITIKDPDQPLIVYCPRRLGEVSMQTEVNYLVPEICYLTGLTDRAHRNARARKTYPNLPLDSAGRQAEISYFNDMIQRNSVTVKYLNQCGIDVVSAVIALNPSILELHQGLSGNDTATDDDKDSEQQDIIDIEHSYGHFASPVDLKHWLLVYPKIDEERVTLYVDMLQQVGQQQGMHISKPIRVILNDDETEAYANALRDNFTNQIQLVSVIVKSRRVDRYNTIKRICCLERSTPTEIILRSTIADDDILSRAVLNIAQEINFKLGGQTRATNINMPNLMIIGLATWTPSHVNYPSAEHLDYVLGIVSSTNQSMTQYFSHSNSYTDDKSLRSDVGLFVRLAIDAYFAENKTYPSTIVIGRNVFSSVDDLYSIKRNEIQLIIDTIAQTYVMERHKPRIIIFTFMKQMIYDLYNYVQPKKIANVNCQLAQDSPSYYFYLSSHRDHSSTLQARQFLVLFDNTDLSAQKIQRLVLYLTLQCPQRNQFFLPSICRFAQRLTALVGETLGAVPDFSQNKNLFYL